MNTQHLIPLAFVLTWACDYQRDLGAYPSNGNAVTADAAAPFGQDDAGDGGSTQDGGSGTAEEGGATDGSAPLDGSTPSLGDGRCTGLTAPVVLATGQTNVRRPAVDADGVYFTALGTQQDSGIVMKVPKSGGVLPPLLDHLGQPDLLVADGGFLYWTDNVGTVRRMSTSGGAAIPFLKPDLGNGVGFEDMTTFGGALYWTGHYAERFSDGGMGLVFTGATTSLSTADTKALYTDHLGTDGTTRFDSITADATGVYWLKGDTSTSSLWGLPSNGFVGQQIAQVGSVYGQTVVDAAGLYVREMPSGVVYRVDKTTNGSEHLLVEPNAFQYAGKMGIDGGNLYWFDSRCQETGPEQQCVGYLSTLYRASTSGPTTSGTPVVTLTTSVQIEGFAFDATCIYWTNSRDGTVAKFQK